MVPSAGALTPSFSKDILEYSLVVDYNISNINFTYTTEDSNARVSVQDASSNALTLPATLSDSPLAITFLVTADDDATTHSYKVTVNKYFPQASLSSLVPSLGTLIPSFNRGAFSYTLTTTASTIHFNFATKSNSGETVSVLDESNTVLSLPVVVGYNPLVVKFRVTAANSKINTYVVTVKRIFSDLIITEVGSTFFANSSPWIEVFNPTDGAINLAEYSVRSQTRLRVDPYTINKDDKTFAVPSLTIVAGTYALIRGRGHDKLIDGTQIVYIIDGDTILFWNANGYVELLKNGSTVDFVRFGTNSTAPTTAAAWTGTTTVAALPSAKLGTEETLLASKSSPTPPPPPLGYLENGLHQAVKTMLLPLQMPMAMVYQTPTNKRALLMQGYHSTIGVPVQAKRHICTCRLYGFY